MIKKLIIHDEESDPVIDFSWFYFIGRAKFGLSFQETGKLTLTAFNKLYRHYKNDFDLEMRLTAANTTYAEAHKKAQKDDEWF